MRKHINYLISILFICFLCSCTINVGNKDKNDNGDGTQPPTPNNPYPSDGATDISLTPQLSWNCSFSNSNYWFDIYLDTCNPPNCMETSGLFSFNYNVNTPLKGNKTYYWKICAKNDNGECDGNVWRFTTSESGLPADGLVAYYPFNGNANDESGNGNNGQNNGADLIYDRFNNQYKAYSFNGANSYIVVPHSNSLQPTDGLTLSAWVKFNNLSNTSSVLNKGSDTLVGCYSLRYQSASHKLDFQINFSDYLPGPRITVSSSSTMQSDVWYNAIGTYDGSSMKIYLNGQLENSISMSKSLGSNYDALVFGNSEEGYSLNGDLDDIRIYKRALNDAEIQQLYHEGGWQKK